jgi:hypothetical protein
VPPYSPSDETRLPEQPNFPQGKLPGVPAMLPSNATLNFWQGSRKSSS